MHPSGWRPLDCRTYTSWPHHLIPRSSYYSEPIIRNKKTRWHRLASRPYQILARQTRTCERARHPCFQARSHSQPAGSATAPGSSVSARVRPPLGRAPPMRANKESFFQNLGVETRILVGLSQKLGAIPCTNASRQSATYACKQEWHIP